MGLLRKYSAIGHLSDPIVALEWAQLSGALQECGEIASLRLSNVLAEVLPKAAEYLFGQATLALTPPERELWLDAADFARVCRLNLVHDFGRYVETHYVRACKRRPSAISGFSIDFDITKLRILEYDHVDEILDTDMIKQAIQYVAWGNLNRMTQCFSRLMDFPELEPMDAPIGPRMIESALADALRAQPWRPDAKRRLLRALRTDFPGRVNLFYSDLASYMTVLGYVPSSVLVAPRNETLRPAPPLVASDDVDMAAVDECQAQADTPFHQPQPESVEPSVAEAQEPAVEGEPYRLLLATLRPGMWMEYHLPGQAAKQLRLAWVSPLKGLFLWTTQQGERALCLNGDAMADALGDGRAKLIKAPAGKSNVVPAAGETRYKRTA